MKACRFVLAIALFLVSFGSFAEERVPTSRQKITLSFASVVRETAPAVVNIYATRVLAERISPFAGDPFFSQFFRGFDRAVPRVQNSLGSGVILDETGIVVSNYHVVGEASDIRVVLNDRREFNGRVLLADQEADIAIIGLEDAADLPALQLGNSDAVEVGDLVLAIGNPFGVGQTVSSGIVSGLARSGGNLGARAGYYLQTDAPINPGNSGGALVDMDGRLIGVNTSILTRSGGSNGIGFAIPSNLVRQYIEQALEGRDQFAKPWSGVRVQEIDSSLALALGMTVPSGVLITELHPSSPFAAIGVQSGDVLLEIDGLPVNAPAELDYRLATRGLASHVSVTFKGKSEIQTAGIDLSEAPNDPPANPKTVESASPLNGLVVSNVNPLVIEEMGLPFDADGVVVRAAQGYSARVGLRPGDMLIAINGSRVLDTGDVLQFATAQTRNWNIELVRDGRRFSLRFAI
ncbi:trypsin-like peptidase domain-containing protein [Ovoidimarina sediminis]|uniref:trypsin-like peptidase domain-containing protein n=1 Tax=Ovoidimarina sediminis TaxID=3079856 RepID=UPI0029114AF6|nr:trypsin-like peptidase domain-containing protein [Rhodophyticola sp. MJ-SS7]MDU8945946.1 trypsin-like peptidase domain-containing protein [Rhodophyticola sp. MJ-SS7]